MHYLMSMICLMSQNKPYSIAGIEALLIAQEEQIEKHKNTNALSM